MRSARSLRFLVAIAAKHRLRSWNAKKQAWKSFYQVPRIRRTVLQADLGIGELTPESLREHQCRGDRPHGESGQNSPQHRNLH